jgi:phosphohistidine phosphatase
MKSLILLRHAKAAPIQTNQQDQDRPLAARGQRDAPNIGAWIAAQDLKPDFVLVSTAARTRQTWQLVAPCLDDTPTVEERDDLYLASPEHLLSAINAVAAKKKSVLVIGHNPGLEMLAALLTNKANKDDRKRMDKKFPTAACAVITFKGSSWKTFRPGTGDLVAFQVPRDLDDEPAR